MKAIIYETNSGSTQRYAEMLADKLGIPAYSLIEAQKRLPKGEEAIFLGWVFANKIQGLKKAHKNWKLLCVGAVGIDPVSEKYHEILKEANPTDAPIFYLRGRLDFKKLKWLQRKLLETVRADLEKQNKPGNEEMISVMKDGCDFVSEDMLSELLAFALIHQ